MSDYNRIAEAIEYIAANTHKQPSLEQIANKLQLSPYHFQRLFSQWAGISPKRFLQTLTVHHAKTLLDKSNSILSVSNELGLSSTARLHDSFISLEAVTPGEYKAKGENITITYGMHDTVFGLALIAITDRGICHLSFIDKRSKNAPALINTQWPAARLQQSNKKTKPVIDSLFKQNNTLTKPLSLYVKGTNFQVSVWRALLKIPRGQLCSYGQLAKLLGKPKASRAVGTAIGANPVAFIIPCHRVILASGVIGNYRWGNIRKRAILSWETA